MCQFISFFHNPNTGEIKVKDLNSHSDTQEQLSLDENFWREGHYLPDGIIICRTIETDRVTQKECETRLKATFPQFVDFFKWALNEIGQTECFNGSLDLRGLTSADGLTLPEKVNGWLDLRVQI